ncbi:MAG TPA: hypothetical protein V6C76_02070 [Drouetiella sp.]
MTFQSEKKCTFCAELIRANAVICRFCNRAVAESKACTACFEPIRLEAKKCRFCLKDQPEIPIPEKHPPVTGIVPSSLSSFGFQTPPYTPVYKPIEPNKLPEQCQSERDFEDWQKRRTNAIKYGAQDD